ncbi:DUF222 domain-containing protein [Nakamurella aerolata]|uniref:DUF222 domain-containing protein n=1 Tax=Nakamurella aerolata TaxID=1656892 RepID=A0A849A7M2_9ACTN|nr:DUF222 domain-containing protein [Nakamurella aerolata]NNG35051.1 DUF222 domain-containing protein [Nakamurella aerolata]
MSTVVSGDGPAGSADPLRRLCEEVIVALDSGDAVRDAAAGIDRIAALEQLCGAAAGMIAAQSLAFERAERARQRAAGVRPREVGRGAAEQIGFARRMSPAGSARQLGVARSLSTRWPILFAQLRAGRVSWTQCQIVCRESRHLDDDQARLLDTGMSERVCGWSPADTERAVRKAVYTIDPHGSIDKRAHAESERRVTLRPLPDAMAMVSALLPVEQGVAIYTTLTNAAKNTKTIGDQRTLDQLRADALIHRLSPADPHSADPRSADPRGAAPPATNALGAESADPATHPVPSSPSDPTTPDTESAGLVPHPAPPPILVNMTISADTLLANSNEPAILAGYGPIPAELGRALAAGEPLTRPEPAPPDPLSEVAPPHRTADPIPKSALPGEPALPGWSGEPSPSSELLCEQRSTAGRALGDSADPVSDGGLIVSGRLRGSPAEPAGRLPDQAAAHRNTTSEDPDKHHNTTSNEAAEHHNTIDEANKATLAPARRPNRAVLNPKRARVWLQRLLVHPVTGIPTNIDPRRREFTGCCGNCCWHATRTAPNRSAAHRPGTPTTSGHTRSAATPHCPTAKAYAPPATTPRRSPAGNSAPPATHSPSPHPPDTATAPTEATH